MPVISFVCLLAILLILISAITKKADLLSPGRVFILLWLFIIGIVELKFSRLQSEWDLFDWFMVLLALLTFLMGIYISYIINLDKPFHSVSKIRLKFRELEINESRLFTFIIIYFFLCLISFIIEWQIEGYIPLFTSKPDSARVMFGIYGLHYIVNSINVVYSLLFNISSL